MGMPKGRSGNPAGRPVGAVGKKTMLKENVLRRILHGKNTPLEFLLATMMADDMPMGIRIDAAKAAAPYVHKRMPIQLELEAETNNNHNIKGGVMIVPAIGANAEEWGKLAAAAQATLKEDVRK